MTKVNNLPFNTLITLFGTTCPARDIFCSRGGTNLVSFLDIIKFYNARNISAAWKEFERDYNLYSKNPKQKVEEKSSSKDEPTMTPLEKAKALAAANKRVTKGEDSE